MHLTYLTYSYTLGDYKHWTRAFKPFINLTTTKIPKWMLSLCSHVCTLSLDLNSLATQHCQYSTGQFQHCQYSTGQFQHCQYSTGQFQHCQFLLLTFKKKKESAHNTSLCTEKNKGILLIVHAWCDSMNSTTLFTLRPHMFTLRQFCH